MWCSSKLRLRKGHPIRARHKQDWGQGFIFLLPQAAVLDYPNQILAVVVLSQHRVLPYKTFRPHATCDVRCMGHIIRTWFAFFLMAQHSKFGKGAGPHLYIYIPHLHNLHKISVLQQACFTTKGIIHNGNNMTSSPRAKDTLAALQTN